MNRARILHTAAFLASKYVHYRIVMIQLLTSRVYSMNVLEHSWHIRWGCSDKFPLLASEQLRTEQSNLRVCATEHSGLNF